MLKRDLGKGSYFSKHCALGFFNVLLSLLYFYERMSKHSLSFYH